MNVSQNDLPGEEAEKRFPRVFASWRMELLKGRWPDWPAMQRHYPTASRMGDGIVHFPLAKDGSGIACAVCFKPGVIRLLRIVMATPHATRRVPLFHPTRQPQPHATTK